jgi:hypothetical protein
MPSSNIFIDGNDGNKYIIDVIQTLIKNGYENIALYTDFYLHACDMTTLLLRLLYHIDEQYCDCIQI